MTKKTKRSNAARRFTSSTHFALKTLRSSSSRTITIRAPRPAKATDKGRVCKEPNSGSRSVDEQSANASGLVAINALLRTFLPIVGKLEVIQVGTERISTEKSANVELSKVVGLSWVYYGLFRKV